MISDDWLDPVAQMLFEAWRLPGQEYWYELTGTQQNQWRRVAEAAAQLVKNRWIN
jgi:hypothetical protein